jgi:hypothetical protein
MAATQSFGIKTPRYDLMMKASSLTSCSFKSVVRVAHGWSVKGQYDYNESSPSSCLVGLSVGLLNAQIKVLMTPELVFDVVSGWASFGIGMRLGYDFRDKHWSHVDLGASLDHNNHKVLATLKTAAERSKCAFKLAYRYQPTTQQPPSTKPHHHLTSSDDQQPPISDIPQGTAYSLFSLSQGLTFGSELVYHFLNESSEFCFVSQYDLADSRLLKIKLSSSGLLSASLRNDLSCSSAIVTALGLQARNVSALQAKDFAVGVRLVFGQDNDSVDKHT